MTAIHLFHIPRQRARRPRNGSTSLNPMMHYLVQIMTLHLSTLHKKTNRSQKSSHRRENSPFSQNLTTMRSEEMTLLDVVCTTTAACFIRKRPSQAVSRSTTATNNIIPTGSSSQTPPSLPFWGGFCLFVKTPLTKMCAANISVLSVHYYTVVMHKSP